MNKDILRLSACQALFVSSASIMITTSAMVGANLASKAQYATLGVGMTFLAMMICSYPMSILMGKIGRRGGFYSWCVCRTVRCGAYSFCDFKTEFHSVLLERLRNGLWYVLRPVSAFCCY